MAEKPLQTETQSTWQTIISSKEYKEAQKTGKTLNFTTFSSDETADDDAEYFLIKTTSFLSNSPSNENPKLKDMKIEIDDWRIILEIEIDKNFSDLPFFCFQDSNVSSIEELNFNALKKCTWKNENKYMLIFSGDYVDKKEVHNNFGTDFVNWNNKEPNVLIEITDDQDKTGKIFGKMLKIFRKEYKPDTNKNT